MGFSLGDLFFAGLLLVNAVAVLQDFSPSLHPNGAPVPRFLAKSLFDSKIFVHIGLIPVSDFPYAMTIMTELVFHSFSGLTQHVDPFPRSYFPQSRAGH